MFGCRIARRSSIFPIRSFISPNSGLLKPVGSKLVQVAPVVVVVVKIVFGEYDGAVIVIGDVVVVHFAVGFVLPTAITTFPSESPFGVPCIL